MAKNYVQHLREKAIPGKWPAASLDQETAEMATHIITNHGGYEVAYFPHRCVSSI